MIVGILEVGPAFPQDIGETTVCMDFLKLDGHANASVQGFNMTNQLEARAIHYVVRRHHPVLKLSI